MCRRCVFRVIALLAAGTALHGPAGLHAEERVAPAGRPLHVSVDWKWVPLPASPGSALRVCVSRAGIPYEDTLESCRVTDLRREFRLPQSEYILGEPVVVEMCVTLEGPGRWHERVGGAYRRLGRDDNFLFLLRAADGSWVPDPYDAYRSFTGGGMSSAREVTAGSSFSYWLAIQRWATIEHAGVYDLFAVHFASRYRAGSQAAIRDAIERRHGRRWVLEPGGWHAHDRGSPDHRQVVTEWRDAGPDPPLIAAMPPELRARLGAGAASVQDFAHFRITIQPPSPAETAAMVERSVRLAETSSIHPLPSSRADATREAIAFIRQDCFIPALANWMRADSNPALHTGLAMNPSASAQALLFDGLCRGTVDARWYLPPAHIRNAIPALIARLEDPERDVRETAERYLRSWTELPFGPPGRCRASLADEPAPEEPARTRAAWERWWQRNATTFQPRDPFAPPRPTAAPGPSSWPARRP